MDARLEEACRAYLEGEGFHASEVMDVEIYQPGCGGAATVDIEYGMKNGRAYSHELSNRDFVPFLAFLVEYDQ